MKIYLLKKNGINSLIIQNNDFAKMIDAAPLRISQIDLYAENASEQLRNRFSAWDKNGMLKNFYDIFNKNEIALSDLTQELGDAELVYESE